MNSFDVFFIKGFTVSMLTFTKTKLKGTVHLVGYFKYTSGIHNGLVFNNSNVQIGGNRTPPPTLIK